MKVYLERKSGIHLESRNTDNNHVSIDGKKEVGGQGKGMRPMELLLTAVASCSSMTLITMAEKQQMSLQEYAVEVSGTRTGDDFSSPFSHIHLRYVVKGKIDEEKFSRLAQLALEKYCSVSACFSPDLSITHEVVLQ